MITKRKLAKSISNRLSGTISQAKIYDAITVICDDLFERLVRNESVSIDNLGTLHVSILNISIHNIYKTIKKTIKTPSDKINYIVPVRIIKFTPHYNFSFLLNERREDFIF